MGAGDEPQNAARRCRSVGGTMSPRLSHTETDGGSPLRGSRSIASLSKAALKTLGRIRKLRGSTEKFRGSLSKDATWSVSALFLLGQM